VRIRILLLAFGALLVAFALVVLSSHGVPLDFALSWVLIVVTMIALSRQTFIDETSAWPPEPRPRRPRGSDVSRLAWSINPSTGAVGHVMMRRVERIVRRRLAARDLDLDDPAQHPEIDALLGPGIRELLQRREVLRSDVERILDAADRCVPEQRRRADV